MENNRRSPSKPYEAVYLPPVIDREMADAVGRLTDEKLDEILGGKLNADEVVATKARLAELKEHVNDLSAAGRVIASTEWSGDLASRALSEKKVIDEEEYPQSYIDRDHEKADG